MLSQLLSFLRFSLLTLTTILLGMGCASVPRPDPQISFTSSLYRIDSTASIILYWSVINVDSINISPFIGSLPLLGNKTISPIKTTNYELTAFYGDKTVKQNLEVVVIPPKPKVQEITPLPLPPNTSIGTPFPKEGESKVLPSDPSEISIPEKMKSGIVKENLGTTINSSCDDLMPVVSADRKNLFFARYNEYRAECDHTSKIWQCNRKSDGGWSPASKLGFPLNHYSHSGVISISPDNNYMLLMNQYNEDGSPRGGGISYTTRGRKGSWNIPINMNIENFYNHNKYAEFNMSVDRSVLFMSIQRDDSYGDKDIYVSFRLFEGYYSEPLNLGAVINTNRTEISPFLASDGKTLYFSSDGHPGYGGSDIFVSRRLDNTWQHWSKPFNLGNEINTREFDAYFTIVANGEEVYMVGTGEDGSADIIKLNLPDVQEIRPLPVTLLKGKVKNRKSHEPANSRIVYKNDNNQDDWGYALTNPDDGSFQIALPAGEDYTFYADGNNSFPIAKKYSTKKQKKYEEVENNLEQVDLPELKGEPIFVRERLTFGTAGKVLRKDAQIEIDRLYEFLKQNPKLNVEIAGYTDSRGTDAVNKILSKERALLVANRLISKGISPNRIKSTGYGKNNPIDNNETEEGRQKNRRVEFVFYDI